MRYNKYDKINLNGDDGNKILNMFSHDIDKQDYISNILTNKLCLSKIVELKREVQKLKDDNANMYLKLNHSEQQYEKLEEKAKLVLAEVEASRKANYERGIV